MGGFRRIPSLPVMDPDTLAAAVAHRARGESPTQIAKALGVCRARIHRHLPPTDWPPPASPTTSPSTRPGAADNRPVNGIALATPPRRGNPHRGLQARRLARYRVTWAVALARECMRG
jgi:hypothetical protein